MPEHSLRYDDCSQWGNINNAMETTPVTGWFELYCCVHCRPSFLCKLEI